MKSNTRSNSRHLYSEEIRFETMVTGAEMVRSAQYRAHCLNISQGGLAISTAYKLRERQIVKLSLPLKGFDVTVPVLAEVLWVKAANRHNRAGVRYVI